MACSSGPKYRPSSSGDKPSSALIADSRTLCSLSSSNGPSNKLRWPLGTRPLMLLIAAIRTSGDSFCKSAFASFRATELG
jgi:hypothetical protein